MTTKNFSAAVSAYLDIESRAWETAVFLRAKPVLDRELNIAQDIDAGLAQSALRTGTPSGWLSTDFLRTASHSSGIMNSISPTSLVVEIPSLLAHVNGWVVPVVHSNVSGANRLTLTTGPAGVGAKRTDVVILEVWRKLISAAPSTDGKSPLGRIWRNGNVKVASGDDVTLNFADDLFDANVGSETTKRVQIQYRLRVIPNVDLFTYPAGLDDPLVTARSTPPAAATPDGNSTSYVYQNQASNGDAGLWRAGDGNPANTLNTVDGYMYAIPLMAVFRRNTTAFNRVTNHNGGVAHPTASDRPDGLWQDIIVADDVADLRHGVNPNGWDHSEVLEKAVNILFDNNSKTEWGTTPNGGGVAGHSVLWADEIGVSDANGGNGAGGITGDTAGATFVGEFDNVRRTFSDRTITEIARVRIAAPMGGWLSSSVATIDPTAFTVYPYSAYNFAAYNPANVALVDITAARFVGTGVGRKSVDAMPHVKQITGLGAIPMGSLSVSFATSLTGVALNGDEDLFVDVLISYPSGLGLSRTPVADFGALSISVNNPGQLPASAPIYYQQLSSQNGLVHHNREVRLLYETLDVTFGPVINDSSGVVSTVVLPERAVSITSIFKNGATPMTGTLDTTGRVINLTGGNTTSATDTVTVTYKALRPLPQNGEQLTIYYNTRSPQPVRNEILSSLSVVPKRISEHLHTVSLGSGTDGEGYPFPQLYAQLGGVYPSSAGTFNGEHEFAASAYVAVGTFSAQTGHLRVPVHIGYVPNPESVSLVRSPGDVDIEGRSYFRQVGAGYVPNAYGPPLSDPKKHRVVLPMLAELTADTAFGKRGMLVLVLFLRYVQFSGDNSVFFVPSDASVNTTTAAMFRIKGNLLSRRQ